MEQNKAGKGDEAAGVEVVRSDASVTCQLAISPSIWPSLVLPHPSSSEGQTCARRIRGEIPERGAPSPSWGSSEEHRHAGRSVPGITGGAARASLAAVREEWAALPRAGAGRRSPGALPELSANGWTRRKR